MANIGHTYDASCMLHTDLNVFNRRTSQILIGPPPIKAHYFYCSSLPIDDPLLPVPPPTTSSTRSARIPPRPFSVHDNRALEEAWLKIHKPFKSIESPKRPLEDYPLREPLSKDGDSKIHETVTNIFKGAQEKYGSRKTRVQGEVEHQSLPSGSFSPAKTQAEPAQSVYRRRTGSTGEIDPLTPSTPKQSRFKEHSTTQTDLPNDFERAPLSQVSPVTAEEIDQWEVQAGLRSERRRSRSPFRRNERQEGSPDVNLETGSDLEGAKEQVSGTAPNQQNIEYGSSPTERSTTGTPFVRIASRLSRSRSRSRPRRPSIEIGSPPPVEHAMDGGTDNTSSSPSRATLQRRPRADHLRRDPEASDYAASKNVQETKVSVGVSRLHVVELPLLKVCITLTLRHEGH